MSSADLEVVFDHEGGGARPREAATGQSGRGPGARARPARSGARSGSHTVKQEPLLDRALDGHGAAVQLGEELDHGEAQPRPLELPREPAVDLTERA